MYNLTQQRLGKPIATLVQNVEGGGAVGTGASPGHNAVPAAPTGNPVSGIWNMGPTCCQHQGVMPGMAGMVNTAPGAHGMLNIGLQGHGIMPGEFWSTSWSTNTTSDTRP
jgi:hypothetical protein